MQITALKCSGCDYTIGGGCYRNEFKKSDGEWVPLSHPGEIFKIWSYLEEEGLPTWTDTKDRQRCSMPFVCMDCIIVNWFPQVGNELDETKILETKPKCSSCGSERITTLSILSEFKCPKCQGTIKCSGIFCS